MAEGNVSLTQCRDLGHREIVALQQLYEDSGPRRCASSPPAATRFYNCAAKRRSFALALVSPEPHETGYSITSLAVASKSGETLSPSVWAAFRFRTRSKVVGRPTGKLPGLVPLRIRPA